jgi:hypothetical protein
MGAQASPGTHEYANLPISNVELATAIRHAGLIVRAKITSYKPAAVQNGSQALEQTTITVEDVYFGNARPGDAITYVCLCHMVEAPAAHDLVGHEVLSLLRFDKRSKSWSPATKVSPLFYNDGLRERIQRQLRRSK